jgi:hypothetical protein
MRYCSSLRVKMASGTVIEAHASTSFVKFWGRGEPFCFHFAPTQLLTHLMDLRFKTYSLASVHTSIHRPLDEIYNKRKFISLLDQSRRDQLKGIHQIFSSLFNNNDVVTVIFSFLRGLDIPSQAVEECRTWKGLDVYSNEEEYVGR